MKIPDIDCSMEASCPVNPSEDPDKVKRTISNILPYSAVHAKDFSITAKSKDLASFEKIYETVHARQSQKAYRRSLEKNKSDNSTWFYLNKQAAFVGKMELCEDAEESPLGPINVTLVSPDIDRVIGWIISN